MKKYDITAFICKFFLFEKIVLKKSAFYSFVEHSKNGINSVVSVVVVGVIIQAAQLSGAGKDITVRRANLHVARRAPFNKLDTTTSTSNGTLMGQFAGSTLNA